MRIHLIIGFVISAVCMYFAFRGISFADLYHSLRAADPSWILFAISFYSVGFFLRTQRWKILLKPLKTIPASQLLGPLIIGFFANNILPFRMGEFVRAQVAGRKFHISRTSSLGTILLERLYDTVSFLSTFIAVALFFPFPKFVEKGAALLAAACFLTVTTLLLISRHEHRFHELLDHSPLSDHWKSRIRRTVSNFVKGVAGLNHFGDVAKALSLSLVIWMIEGSFLYLIGRAFHLPLGYPQSFFMLFFIGLSVTVPQAPGYVGTFELFGVTALSLLGIPKEQGLPMVLSVHGIQFLLTVIGGTLALTFEKISFSEMFKITTTASEEGSE